MKRDRGSDVVKSAIGILLCTVNDFFNLPNPMKAIQIEQTTELIMERYYYLKLEEFQLCFKNAMAGDYGPLFNRLDGSVIFEWLKKFDAERDRAVEIKRNEETARSNMYEIFQSPAMQKVLGDVVSKMEANKQAPAPEPKRVLSPFEKQVQEEWNRLPENDYDWRMRFYEGSAVDFTTYRRLRFAEEIGNQGEL